MRSYLHTNCAHCHRPGGEQQTLDLRYGVPLADSGLCDNNRIVPGDAAGSLIHQRDGIRGGGQMPPLASDQLDDAQLGVLADWINQLVSCP